MALLFHQDGGWCPVFLGFDMARFFFFNGMMWHDASNHAANPVHNSIKDNKGIIQLMSMKTAWQDSKTFSCSFSDGASSAHQPSEKATGISLRRRTWKRCDFKRRRRHLWKKMKGRRAAASFGACGGLLISWLHLDVKLLWKPLVNQCTAGFHSREGQQKGQNCCRLPCESWLDQVQWPPK